jgi:hypothetical protein
MRNAAIEYKKSRTDVESQVDEEKSLTEEGPQSPSSSLAHHPFRLTIGSKAEQTNQQRHQ